jgi:hypothetical protein
LEGLTEKITTWSKIYDNENNYPYFHQNFDRIPDICRPQPGHHGVAALQIWKIGFGQSLGLGEGTCPVNNFSIIFLTNLTQCAGIRCMYCALF